MIDTSSSLIGLPRHLHMYSGYQPSLIQLVSQLPFFRDTVEKLVCHQLINWNSISFRLSSQLRTFKNTLKTVLLLLDFTLKVPNGTLISNVWWNLRLWSSKFWCQFFTLNQSQRDLSHLKMSMNAHATIILLEKVLSIKILSCLRSI